MHKIKVKSNFSETCTAYAWRGKSWATEFHLDRYCSQSRRRPTLKFCCSSEGYWATTHFRNFCNVFVAVLKRRVRRKKRNSLIQFVTQFGVASERLGREQRMHEEETFRCFFFNRWPTLQHVTNLSFFLFGSLVWPWSWLLKIGCVERLLVLFSFVCKSLMKAMKWECRVKAFSWWKSIGLKLLFRRILTMTFSVDEKIWLKKKVFFFVFSRRVLIFFFLDDFAD